MSNPTDEREAHIAEAAQTFAEAARRPCAPQTMRGYADRGLIPHRRDSLGNRSFRLGDVRTFAAQYLADQQKRAEDRAARRAMIAAALAATRSTEPNVQHIREKALARGKRTPRTRRKSRKTAK
jgi:DNA-binding transcriptional MerR regulator